MKSIMISIRPEWVAKILNGEKTIEVRKTAPKCDLPIEVYIYCTNDRNGFLTTDAFQYFALSKKAWTAKSGYYYNFNGKVLAKFTLREVEIFDDFDDELCDRACLDRGKILDYLGTKLGYAWLISDLVIFDEPKELSEFGFHYDAEYCNGEGLMVNGRKFVSIERPPQSWCYCEERYHGATMRKIELPKEVEAKPYKKGKR